MSKDIEKEIMDLEKQYWEAMQNRDVDAAMRLTDESCIVVGAQGVGLINKAQMAEMMRAARYTVNKIEFVGNMQVKLLSDDVGVIAYRVREDLFVDDKQIVLEAADSSTWIRRNGRWFCALHTESVTGDPFGRDRRAAA